jgi:hypothetical protein
MTKLKVDYCDYKAAMFAVKRWHYSKSMPTPPVVSIGVWENDKYIGCVLFSRGATQDLGTPYGLEMTEVCELTRVALAKHESPVSQIVSEAIKFLKTNSPKLRLIVSFADPNHGHHGGIYQAGNWTYTGDTGPSYKYMDKRGRIWHGRQVSSTGVKRQYGELRLVPRIDDCTRIFERGKYRYLYPLDRKMRKQIEPLRKPYPKREVCGPSVESDMPGDQPVEAGATPAGRSEVMI